MSHITFRGGKPLTIPQIAKLADYTREHMARMVRSGRFPFESVQRDGKQKRYEDTPKLRQWCSDNRLARMAAKERPASPYSRWMKMMTRLNSEITKQANSGRLDDPEQIAQVEDIISFALENAHAKLRSAKIRALRRREMDNLL